MTDTTVLIASPSAISRNRVSALIAAMPGHSVIATAADLSETFNSAEILAPDLILIAEEFTRVEEFSVMRALFKALGTRWFLLGSGPAREVASPDPRLDLSQPPEVLARLLRLPEGARPAAAQPPRPASTASQPDRPRSFDKLVVIGSSTGGVDALITLLQAFPVDCPPTAIVQHTGRGFSDSLVQLLRRRCKPQVVAAAEGLALTQGTICLAGGVDGHLTLAPGTPPRCHLRAGPPVSGHIPSIDMLFRSALPLAPRVVGVILTGMGQDGAAGLLDLRRAGAITLGQDEATSVVYGMPKAAWDRGAVQQQLPLPRIGDEILRAASSTTPADRRMAAR